MVLLNASRTAIFLSIKSEPPRLYKYKLKALRETLTQPYTHTHTNTHTRTHTRTDIRVLIYS